MRGGCQHVEIRDDRRIGAEPDVQRAGSRERRDSQRMSLAYLGHGVHRAHWALRDEEVVSRPRHIGHADGEGARAALYPLKRRAEPLRVR